MGNRTALYLTDRQYTDLLKALEQAKQYRRNVYAQQRENGHPAAVALECAALAEISGLQREVFEQVIVVKAGE